MDVFIGTIVAFGFDFVPRGWEACDGRLLSVTEHSALFKLIGTTYGGDGEESFALPDLQGRTVIGSGTGTGLNPYKMGEAAGSESVTLTLTDLPSHTHGVTASGGPGNVTDPSGASLANVGRNGINIYNSDASNSLPVVMSSGTTSAGGNQPHNNMQPYVALNYCIATTGIYPSAS